MSGSLRVQNIGQNLRERASASWATSILRRASERELDDFRFLASERASLLTRSQARSHLTLALDGSSRADVAPRVKPFFLPRKYKNFIFEYYNIILLKFNLHADF